MQHTHTRTFRWHANAVYIAEQRCKAAYHSPFRLQVACCTWTYSKFCCLNCLPFANVFVFRFSYKETDKISINWKKKTWKTIQKFSSLPFPPCQVLCPAMCPFFLSEYLTRNPTLKGNMYFKSLENLAIHCCSCHSFRQQGFFFWFQSLACYKKIKDSFFPSPINFRDFGKFLEGKEWNSLSKEIF